MKLYLLYCMIPFLSVFSVVDFKEDISVKADMLHATPQQRIDRGHAMFKTVSVNYLNRDIWELRGTVR